MCFEYGATYDSDDGYGNPDIRFGGPYIDGGVRERGGASACQKSCQLLRDCNFWTYNADKMRCYRKYGMNLDEFRYAIMLISGPKYCGMFHLNSKLGITQALKGVEHTGCTQQHTTHCSSEYNLYFH